MLIYSLSSPWCLTAAYDYRIVSQVAWWILYQWLNQWSCITVSNTLLAVIWETSIYNILHFHRALNQPTFPVPRPGMKPYGRVVSVCILHWILFIITCCYRCHQIMELSSLVSFQCNSTSVLANGDKILVVLISVISGIYYLLSSYNLLI